MWPSDVRQVERATGSVTDEAHRMTRPTDKRVGKRGDALRARSEASMIARMRVARLSAAPAPKSDAALIAEAIAAGKVRHIPRGLSGLITRRVASCAWRRPIRCTVRRRVRSAGFQGGPCCAG